MTETPKFVKTPKQVEATALMAKYPFVLLFGGSRSGKTAITVRNIIIRACKAPNSRHLIARLRFDHVKRSIGMDTLPKVMAMCFPNLKYTLNRADWILTLSNGSQVWLAGTDDSDRVEKILGTEFSTIYVNEASETKDYEIVGLLMTRLAQNCPEIENKAFFDCNPPSKKHWSYRLFIEGVDPIDGKPVPDFETDYASMLMNPGDNLANLPPNYIKMLERLPSRQRQRFLEGKFLVDIEGALWSVEMIDTARRVYHDIKATRNLQPLRTIVAVDPAITNEANSDLWGITVATKYLDGRATMDVDVSVKDSPRNAIKRAIRAYHEHEADAIIAESNQGGDMIKDLLRLLGYKGKITMVHASKGKFSRAEPISALYEQELIGHSPTLGELEEEMMEYVPHRAKKSPDRMDSAVWALTELFKDEMRNTGVEDMDFEGNEFEKVNDFNWEAA